MSKVPDSVTFRGKQWYLHSVVMSKAKATQIAAHIKKELQKTTQIAKIKPALGETGARYAVYWAFRSR